MGHNCVKRNCSCNDCVREMERRQNEFQELLDRVQEKVDHIAGLEAERESNYQPAANELCRLYKEAEEARKIMEVLAGYVDDRSVYRADHWIERATREVLKKSKEVRES